MKLLRLSANNWKFKLMKANKIKALLKMKKKFKSYKKRIFNYFQIVEVWSNRFKSI